MEHFGAAGKDRRLVRAALAGHRAHDQRHAEAFHRRGGLFYQRVQRHPRVNDVGCIARLADGREDRAAAVCLFGNQAEIFGVRIIRASLLHQLLGNQVDGGERCAELMRRHGRHGAQR